MPFGVNSDPNFRAQKQRIRVRGCVFSYRRDSSCSCLPRSRMGARNGCRSLPGAAEAIKKAAQASLEAAGGFEVAARACLGAAAAFRSYAPHYCSETLSLFGCSLHHFASVPLCMNTHGAILNISIYIYIY